MDKPTVSTGDRKPKLSLVVPTLGRSQQIVRLLDSLERQTHQDFEVVIVDQNEDDMLEGLSWHERGFPLRRLHTPGERGASRARNRGWKVARGDYLAFPDDDCWYPAGFVETALGEMALRGLDALTGRPVDAAGRTINGRFQAQAGWITRRNVWTTQIEWLAVFRRDLVERLGGYDEAIGVGASTPWQSAEAQDLMLRALKAGARCWYDPDLHGHHDELPWDGSTAAIRQKARGYARGAGFVLRKHRLGWAASAYWIGRPVAGTLIAAASGRPALARLHAGTAIGRLEGVLGSCFSRS